MRTRVHLSVLACLACAAMMLLLAACGGGSSSGSTESGGDTTAASSSGGGAEYGVGLELGKTIGEAKVGIAEPPYLAWDADSCSYKEVPEPAGGYPTALTREVSGEPQIGYMFYGDTDPFGVANSKSVKAVASEAGFKLNTYNLKYPSETEPIAQAKVSVLKGDLGVMQAQQLPALNGAFLKILQEEGCIPSIQMYLKTPDVPSMGADFGSVGTVQGEWLAEYAAENNLDPKTTALVECTDPELGDTVNVMFDNAPEALRKEGFEIPDENVFKLTCPAQKAESAVTDWFTANPNFDSIMMTTIDDERMKGMTNAAAKTGNEEKVVSIASGVDELGQAQIRSGAETASVAFFPERYGEWLIPLLQDVLAGNPVPSFTGTDLVVITSENIDQYYK